jgi:hypothetical protein
MGDYHAVREAMKTAAAEQNLIRRAAALTDETNADLVEHVHRRPRKKDFEGKTIRRFVRTADNIWKFYFTDGTSLAIQSETFGFGPYPLACMEICDVCA